jgi:hypothetical protein
MKHLYLRVDSRGRIPLKKLSKNELPQLMRAHIEGEKIILEPINEELLNIPAEERWLFAPENKAILAKLKKSLKQEATIPLDIKALEKSLKKKKK